MCMVTTFSGRQGARDARGRALRPVLRAGSGPPDQRVAALHDPAARGLHREAEERLRLAERAIRVARVRAARAAAKRSHVDRDQAARAARDVRRVRRAVPRRSLGRVSGSLVSFRCAFRRWCTAATKSSPTRVSATCTLITRTHHSPTRPRYAALLCAPIAPPGLRAHVASQCSCASHCFLRTRQCFDAHVALEVHAVSLAPDAARCVQM